MTRRSSVRAQTQEIYRAMVEDEADRAARAENGPTPNLSPASGGGENEVQGGGEHAVSGRGEHVAASGVHTDVTARVRALYEGSAVPVREIAQLAGVTERTIYKYAAKHDWKPRYRWTPDGARPRAWRAQQRFEPAKGSGGRFICRADKGKPFAAGLKATDAESAARADADCKRAQAIAAEAEYEAKLDALTREYDEAWSLIGQALAEQASYRAEQDKLPAWRRPPGEDLVESTYDLSIEMALDWARAVREEQTAVRAKFHALLDAERAGPQDEDVA